MPKLFVTYFSNTLLAVSTKITRKGFKNEWYFPYLDEVHRTLCAGMATPEEGNQLFQNFRSMYNQMMLPVTMRHIFPQTLLALFILLAVMLMRSTDDSRIFNSASTLIQDLVVPLCKKPLTPEMHVRLLKWMTVAVTLVFFWGSFFLSQLDFLNLFVTITISIWSAGAGAVVTFGLYSRRGTTWGAYAALIAGGGISVGGMLIQRNWAETIYPMLESRNMFAASVPGSGGAPGRSARQRFCRRSCFAFRPGRIRKTGTGTIIGVLNIPIVNQERQSL